MQLYEDVVEKEATSARQVTQYGSTLVITVKSWSDWGDTVCMYMCVCVCVCVCVYRHTGGSKSLLKYVT